MTLRGVIQGLLRGSDDAEALLADDGYGDLPPEMFGQALASYADTATMAEADALTPVLTELDQGDPADVFAVLDAHDLTDRPDPADLSGTEGLSLGIPAVAGGFELDDMIDDFGSPAEVAEDTDLDRPDDAEDGEEGASAADAVDATDDATDVDSLGDEAQDDGQIADDPFADLFEDGDDTGEADTFDALFDHEPEATGDDPSDLDLDF